MSYFPNELSITSDTGINSDTVISGGNWSGNTYTGAGEENDFAYVGVNLQVDEAGTLYFDFSQDGTNWSTYPVNGFTVASGINEVHTAWKGGRYMRPRFVGVDGSRTYFRLKTYYSSLSLPLSAPLNQSIGADQDATIVRSVLIGQQHNSSNYQNVELDPLGGLHTSIINPLGAFGELKTIEPTAQIQEIFSYGINDDIFDTTTVGASSSAYEANGMAIVSCNGTSTSASVQSKKFAKYRSGQGSMARFTGLFTSGVAGNTQRVGIFDDADGFGFGYNETEFGIFHTNNSSTTWIPQTAWNIDTMDGSGSTSNPTTQLLDPTKGNVFQVIYQYLGFGAITFYVEDASDGGLDPVHQIMYANSNTVPSLQIPTLPIRMETVNTTNSSEVALKSGSMAVFTEGKDLVLGPVNSIENSKTITGETNILTLKGKSTFNSKPNRVSLYLENMSIAGDGNNSVIIRLIKNTTLGGTPAYTSISNQSTVEYDTAGTTVLGGKVVATFNIPKNNGDNINLIDYDIVIYPGETLTFSAESGASNTTSIAVTWKEDI